jgi:large conductance mechanosensitive channel
VEIYREFREFIARGSVVDMAVGIAVGTAFAAIARSLVNDVVMPAAGLLLGNAEFEDLFFTLRAGELAPPPYETLAAAQEAGAVTVNYGLFINSIVTFLIISAAVFLLVRTINRLRRKQEQAPAPTEKQCPFCRLTIPLAATRCGHCTSDLPAGA